MQSEDLVAAPATPLVLAVLSEGDNDGYAILQRVRELSGGQLAWADGMLYPLLHRLSRLGYVTADWRPAPAGRRRRYYTITPTGRGAREECRRRGASASERSGGVWGGLLHSTPARPRPVRRRLRPACGPSPVCADAGTLRGAWR